MANFWCNGAPRILKIHRFTLNILIFGQKSCFLGPILVRPTIFKIPQPNWDYCRPTLLLRPHDWNTWSSSICALRYSSTQQSTMGWNYNGTFQCKLLFHGFSSWKVKNLHNAYLLPYMRIALFLIMYVERYQISISYKFWTQFLVWYELNQQQFNLKLELSLLLIWTFLKELWKNQWECYFRINFIQLYNWHSLDVTLSS